MRGAKAWKNKKLSTWHKFRVLYKFRGELFDTASDNYKHLKGCRTSVTSAGKKSKRKNTAGGGWAPRMFIEAQRTINNWKAVLHNWWTSFKTNIVFGCFKWWWWWLGGRGAGWSWQVRRHGPSRALGPLWHVWDQGRKSSPPGGDDEAGMDGGKEGEKWENESCSVHWLLCVCSLN